MCVTTMTMCVSTGLRSSPRRRCGRDAPQNGDPRPGHAPGRTAFVRYLADIWVEVAPDGELVNVVVDVESMAEPTEAINADGAPPHDDFAIAIRAAQSGTWPSWNYGARPVRRATR